MTLPLLTPIIAVVMTFSVLFTFTDFQLIYVLTRGGPLNATHLMATLSFQRAISGGSLGEGAAIATAMVPFLLAAILFSYFGLQRRAWQQGGSRQMTDAPTADATCRPTRRGCSYLDVAAAAARHGLRCRSSVFLVRAAVPVLLDGDHDVQAERGAAIARGQPVLGHESDARAHQEAAVRHRVSGVAVEHDAGIGGRRRSLSLAAACSPPTRSSGCASAARSYVGHGDLPRLPGAAVDPVHPARDDRVTSSSCSTRGSALILTYPTFLIPFCTWLLMGYFKSIPYELEECALIDGATRWQILVKIILPLAVPGLISAGIFAFTLSWNEFIYALTFVSSSEVKTVPVGVVTELVEGDVYHWGSLMAGALLGSLPVADPVLVLRRVLRLGTDRAR